MAALIAVMVINVIVLALSAQQLRRPAAASDLAAVRQGAAALADYYASEIAELGLENNQAVRGCGGQIPVCIGAGPYRR